MATIETTSDTGTTTLFKPGNTGVSTAALALGIIGTAFGLGSGLFRGWGNPGMGMYPGMPGAPGAQPVMQTPPKLVTQEQLDAARENAKLDAENKLLQAQLYTQQQIGPLAISDAKNTEALKYQQKEIERLEAQLGKVATYSVPLSDVTVPFSTAKA